MRKRVSAILKPSKFFFIILEFVATWEIIHALPLFICLLILNKHMSTLCVKNMTGSVSHHNDECSWAYKAPDEVCVQTQPAPKEGRQERQSMRNSRRSRRKKMHTGIKNMLQSQLDLDVNLPIHGVEHASHKNCTVEHSKFIEIVEGEKELGRN